MIYFREVLRDSPTGTWTPAKPDPANTPSPPVRRPALAWLREAWRRYRSRTYLSQLDEHMLRDIGVTWSEAEREANKPFWRA